MEYIEIQNNKIIGHYCGDFPVKKGDGITRIEIDDFKANIGDDISIYVNLIKGIKKPLKQLIEEGLEKIPEGKKLSADGSKFEDMTDAEKVQAGLLKLEPTQKIGGEFIVEKTKEELFTDGLISSEEYNKYVSEMRQQAYYREADPLGLQAFRGDVDKQVWLDKIAEIKNRYPKAAEIKK